MEESLLRRLMQAPLRGYRGVLRTDTSTFHGASLLAQSRIEELQARERERDPGRLAACGFKAYSQNDEDGIIQEIFRRIGTGDRVFAEFGCSDGVENNTVYLLLSGWSGVWIDGSADKSAAAKSALGPYIARGALRIERRFLTVENIDGILSEMCPPNLDLLSIDIDGNDYWVWNAIHSITPRVVVVEYNPTFRPPVSVAQKYAPDFQWEHTSYGGASLCAFESLGRSKGYALVGCNLGGQNAFFVRDDNLKDRFTGSFTAEEHYMPPNYNLFLLSTSNSHIPGVGEYVLIDKDAATTEP